MSTCSYIMVVLLSILASTNVYGATLPENFTIEGRLYDNNGIPYTANVDIKFEVYSDAAPACVLYREIHSNIAVDSTNNDNDGVFALKLGTGTAAGMFTGGFSLTKIFSNTQIVQGDSGTLNTNTCNLPAGAGNRRYVRVSIKPNSGGAWDQLSPDTSITSVPSAMVAESAETLQGIDSSGFIQKRDDATYDLNQANVESIFSATNFAKLTSILGGNFGSQTLTNVGTPSAAGDAANKGYADGNVGGKVADVSGVGPAAGDGKVLMWDQAQNKWVTGTPSATDATKLPLAGGTMTGAIAMGAQDITNIGHMTMAGQKSLRLGSYDNAQQATLIATPLTVAHKGTMWFNSQTNKMMIWDGSAAIDYLSIGGVAGGDLTGTYPNPTIGAGKVVTAAIADDAIASAKINSTGVAVNRLLITDATTGGTVGYSVCAVGEVLKYGATGWACSTVASLLGNSGVTAAAYGNATQVGSFTVDPQGRVTAATNTSITFPVTSVAGKTGVVTLNTGDLTNAGTAATKDFGTAAGNLPELDAGGKILASVMPAGFRDAIKLQSYDVSANAPAANQVLTWNNGTTMWEPQALPAGASGDITAVAAGTGLTGGAASGDATLSVDVGTVSGKIVQMAASNKLPAVDGSNLTGMQVGQINGAYAQNGNAFGSAATLGTNDNNALNLEANNATAMTILPGGNVGIGTTNPAVKLDVAGVIHATDICDEGGGNCKDLSSGWGAGGDIDGVYAGTGLAGGFASGSGTLSVDVGTVTGKIVQMAASDKLPAVDGSNLTQVNAAKIKGNNVSSAAPTDGFVLTWNNSAGQWEPRAEASLGTVTSVVGGTGLLGGNVTSTGTLSVDVGTVAGKIVQMAASDKLPAVDGSLLTNLNVAGSNGVVKDGNSFGGAMIVGTNDNNKLQFETNNSTIMTIATNGNVGIGSVAPASTLDVNGWTKATGNLIGTGTAGAPSLAIAFDSDTGLWSPGTNTLALSTNALERLRIDASGKVGIGTTSTGSNLGIVASDSSTDLTVINSSSTAARYPRMAVINYDNASGGFPAYYLRNARGTMSAPTATQSNDALGIIYGSGYNSGDGTFKDGASIAFAASQAYSTSGQNGGYITLNTTANSSSSPAERMRITDSGDVAIGTNAANERLTLSGALSFKEMVADPTNTAGHGKLYTKTDGKLYYIDNAGTIKNLSATGGGSVTSVVAGTGLQSNNITSAGTLAVDVGITTGKIVQMAAADKLPAVDGSNLFNLSTALHKLAPATANNTINNANYEQVWNWDSIGIGTAMTISSSSVTTGTLLKVATSSAGATGNLAYFENSSGASTATTMLISNASNGISFRVDDAPGDLTPFVIDSNGSVGIGTNAPNSAYALDVLGNDARINGVQVGRGNSGVASNTAVGSAALGANSSGASNSAFGASALSGNTTGNNNSAFGYMAMLANSTGTENVAVGKQALYVNTSGNENVAVGSGALVNQNANGADRNVAVGRAAMWSNLNGYNNVAVGYGTLYTNTAGTYNTGVGQNALYQTTGNNNTALGSNAGSAITSGNNNVIVGSNSGASIATLSNYMIFSDGQGNERFRIDDNGKVGIGVVSPTAALHLPAGTNAVSGAPLKFTSGTIMTAPENGAMEFDGTDFYLTSLGMRKKVGLTSLTGDLLNVGNITGAGSMTISTGGANNALTLTSVGTSSNVYVNAGTTSGTIELNPGTSSGIVNVNATTASTSPTTGALVVDGGVGIGGALNVTGNMAVDTNTFVLDATTNRVGIGSTTPQVAFDLYRTSNATSGNDGTSSTYVDYIPGGIPSAITSINAHRVSLNSSGGIDMTNAVLTASDSSATHYGTQTLGTAIGLKSGANLGSNATVFNAYGIYSSVKNNGTGTIGEARGIYVAPFQNSSGTITNGYGVYIDQALGTNSWGLYQSSNNNKNYFAGKVGIGTTNPNIPLDVATSSGATQITFGALGAEGGYLGSSAQNNAFFAQSAEWDGSSWTSRGTSAATIQMASGGINLTTNPSTTYGAGFSPTNRLSISSSGVVTIPTATASSLPTDGALVVNGGLGVAFTVNANSLAGRSTGSTGVLLGEYIANNSSGPVLEFKKARTGALNSATSSNLNDELGRIDAYGATGTGYSTPNNPTGIRFIATENANPITQGSKIVFRTVSTGTATGADRMTIDESGYVGIGTTTAGAVLDVRSPSTSLFTTSSIAQGFTGGMNVNTVITNWPRAGYLVVEDEIMSYSSFTGSNFTINGRGLFGTNNVSHPSNSPISYISMMSSTTGSTAPAGLIVKSDGSLSTSTISARAGEFNSGGYPVFLQNLSIPSAIYLGAQNVGTTANWPGSGILMVDGELISFYVISGTQIQITGRGLYGTPTNAHSAIAPVSFLGLASGAYSPLTGTAVPQFVTTTDGKTMVSGTLENRVVLSDSISNAITGTSTITNFTPSGATLANWPASGLIMVESEIMSYTLKNPGTIDITGRGLYNTTPVSHPTTPNRITFLNVVSAQNTTTAPSYYQRSDGTVMSTVYLEYANPLGGVSGTYNITDTSKSFYRVTMNSNVTIQLPPINTIPVNTAYTLTIRVQQNATGGYTLGWTPLGSSIKWDQSGTAPPPASAANKETIYSLTIIGGETVWYGSQVWKEL